jgi:hypothetical protein
MSVVKLTDLILFAQSIDGAKPIIDRISKGELDGASFELRVAMILHGHSVKFKLNQPTGVKGADFDFHIMTDGGLSLPADAKCKASSTEASDQTVRNTLMTGKAQLPKGRPGLIILGFPERWVAESLNALDYNLIDDFLKRTTRIHAVIVVMEWLDVLPDRVRGGLLLQTAYNPRLKPTDKLRIFPEFSDPVKVLSVWAMANNNDRYDFAPKCTPIEITAGGT